MRTSRAAALVLLAATALPLPAASAAPAAHVLVVRGSRSATTDVTFRSRIRAHVDLYVPGARPTATTTGTYAGVWLESLAGPPLGTGTVFVPASWHDQPIGWGAWDREDASLPAGRYRVHLLTDGVSEVRLPVDGLARDMVLRPTGRSVDRGVLVHRQVAGQNAPADHTVIPVVVHAATWTVLVSSVEGDGPVVGESVICLHDGGAQKPCPAGGGPGVEGSGGGVGSHGMSGVARFVAPGEVSPGEHDAEYIEAAATVTTGSYAFALTIG
jgi:hypothetical protein